ncbi:MAG: hypothetical protein ABI782_08330 [Anaerolineaceae bacterium]
MQRRARPSKPAWAAWLLSVVVLLALFAAYVLVTHRTVGAEVPLGNAELNQRDTIYFSIHLATVVVGSVLGFALGKWLNGLGAAFALLFLVVLVSSLAVTQVVTYRLACDGGQNNIVRHWTC